LLVAGAKAALLAKIFTAPLRCLAKIFTLVACFLPTHYRKRADWDALGKCKMQNAKCKMQNAKCKMQNAKCKMQNAKCKMQNAKCVTILQGNATIDTY